MTGNSGWLVAIAAILPLVVLMLTSFVKVSVVIALLRNAIGATDAPSGVVVMGIALVLTAFVMAPVAVDVVNAATAPAPTAPVPTPPATPGRPVDLEGAVRTLAGPEHQTEVDRAMRGVEPMRSFLAKHASTRDRETFAATSTKLGRATKGDEMWVLAPAFLASELREAFAMAVLIFVPFLILDLVVGLSLAALGLTSTSPQTVALPLKLLLFVAVDGWRLLLDSLLPGVRVTGALAGVLREGVLLALLLVAPILIAAVVAGILTGLIAAFTQIQDPAVGLVPRVAAVGVAIVLFAPSIASQLAAFASRLWPLIEAAGRGS